MNPLQIAQQLAQNAETIHSLVAGIAVEQARWRPTAEAWSLLEVINHLDDEEREDFRTRVDLTLHQPATPWPPIHPGSWVTARGYNQRDLAESLQNFLRERQRSVLWLEQLAQPEWTRSRSHPEIGPLTANDLLHSWLAHDFLHIRQLNELCYLFVAQQGPRVDYAGDW